MQLIYQNIVKNYNKYHYNKTEFFKMHETNIHFVLAILGFLLKINYVMLKNYGFIKNIVFMKLMCEIIYLCFITYPIKFKLFN